METPKRTRKTADRPTIEDFKSLIVKFLSERGHKDHHHPHTKLRAADVLLVLAVAHADFSGNQSRAMAWLYEAGKIPARIHDSRLSNKINGLGTMPRDFAEWIATQKKP
jgi:hypothetical protein